MEESDFWRSLEYRVCREMYGLEEPSKLRLWCDGFGPEHFALDSTPAHIEGTAWIVGGRETRWRFKLVLIGSPRSRKDIVWDDLLPADNLTEWLLVDVENKLVVIDISKATPLADEGSTPT